MEIPAIAATDTIIMITFFIQPPQLQNFLNTPSRYFFFTTFTATPTTAAITAAITATIFKFIPITSCYPSVNAAIIYPDCLSFTSLLFVLY